MTDIEKRIAERYKQKALESLETQRVEREQASARTVASLRQHREHAEKIRQTIIVNVPKPKKLRGQIQGGWSIDKEFEYALANELNKP